MRRSRLTERFLTRDVHTAIRRRSPTSLRRLLDSGQDPNGDGFNSSYVSPIEAAIRTGELELVKILLDYGANPEQFQASKTDLDERGRMIHLAIEVLEEDDACPIVELLLDRGAEVDSRMWRYCETPLMVAAERGKNRIVELLLNRGAWLDASDKTRCWTALHKAVQFSHLATVSLLVGRGAYINPPDGYWNSPLDLLFDERREAGGEDQELEVFLTQKGGRRIAGEAAARMDARRKLRNP